MPSSHSVDLDLRPATFDDVKAVADLEAARDPEDPRDPNLLRHWWTRSTVGGVAMRLVDVRDGAAVAFVSARHHNWSADAVRRFGWIRAMLRSDLWSEDGYQHLVTAAEDWLRSEKADVGAVTVGEQFTHELKVLAPLGYREVRRQNDSELNLVERRDHLLAEASRQRQRMQEQGVQLLVLSDDPDPDRMSKLFKMASAAEQDIPTTIPMRKESFDEWEHLTFDHPGIRKDRFWIAREGDTIVGLSVLAFPVQRGLPWTDFTATSRAVRGRGIARALKYQSMAQAIELGYERVRTSNDGDNAPILAINREMGYRLIRPVIELHCELAR